jgi:hypothetical protein
VEPATFDAEVVVGRDIHRGQANQDEAFGFLCNPIHAGAKGHPPLIDEAAWVQNFARAATEVSADTVFRRMVNEVTTSAIYAGVELPEQFQDPQWIAERIEALQADPEVVSKNILARIRAIWAARP